MGCTLHMLQNYFTTHETKEKTNHKKKKKKIKEKENITLDSEYLFILLLPPPISGLNDKFGGENICELGPIPISSPCGLLHIIIIIAAG